MRHIGTIETEVHAKRFVDYMLTQDVDIRVEPEDDHWAVWVINEDKLEDTRYDLEWFQGNPEDPMYESEIQANKVRRERKRKQEKARKQIVNVRDHWSVPKRGPLTTLLIIVCVVVSVVTLFGKKKEPLFPLLSINSFQQVGGDRVSFPKEPFTDIKAGDFWRLITPIFLHFDIMHLTFNMLALYYFGNFIESRRGTKHLVILVLILAVFSNAMQYQFSPNHSPLFGGMSGVIFGLFGYLWIKTLIDPTAGMNLQPSTIFMMMFWFILCFTGWVGNIANIAHAAGLAGGMIVGALSSSVPEVRRKKL
jgi:GlpG protein